MSSRLRGIADLSVAVLAWASCAHARAQTTAFYYGPDVPAELSVAYDQLVVEPGHFRDASALPKGRATLLAYVSLGEVASSANTPIDPAWVVGGNAAWASRVMNLAHPGYRAFVLQHVASLWASGFRGFFLDTLDSYELAAREPSAREQQRHALVTLIRTLAERHPGARILLNRGFALLPELAGQVHGVVAESLFDRWDAAAQRYTRVPLQDRQWLIARLREVRERHGLPVTVIDYRPESERTQALRTALEIAQLGFAPWVCNASLTNLGIGGVEILPRRVMVLTASPEAAADDATARQLEPVLEYLGYVPEYRALTDPLPSWPLSGRYAGIISILPPGSAPDAYGAWLLEQVRGGTRVAMFGAPGFPGDGPVARALGITPGPVGAPGKLPPSAAGISARDALIGFEAEPPPHRVEGVPYTLSGASVERHLELGARHGSYATAIATAAWGGVAFSHVFAMRGLHAERAWVLDPFAFLTRALRLPVMPVPDVTTESGSRVALFAIDARGAAEPARLRGRPSVWSVLRDLLADYPWSHAIALERTAADAVPSELAGLRSLLTIPTAYADAIGTAGPTASASVLASLTELPPLYAARASDPIALPAAPDTAYYAGSSEAYALRRVLETFEYTESPRRLRPIALHFHAYAASSPGGLEALESVYAWLAKRALFVVRVSDYRARIRAFREQVIAQELDGTYAVYGGEALRTLRVPEELGGPDLEHSRAIASSAELPQGRYVTFAANGERRLLLGKRETDRPHLERSNGRIERFSWHAQGMRAELEVNAEAPLVLGFAGLPPRSACTFAWAGGSQALHTDPRGRAQLALAARSTGAAVLTCAAGSR